MRKITSLVAAAVLLSIDKSGLSATRKYLQAAARIAKSDRACEVRFTDCGFWIASTVAWAQIMTGLGNLALLRFRRYADPRGRNSEETGMMRILQGETHQRHALLPNTRRNLALDDTEGSNGNFK